MFFETASSSGAKIAKTFCLDKNRKTDETFEFSLLSIDPIELLIKLVLFDFDGFKL